MRMTESPLIPPEYFIRSKEIADVQNLALYYAIEHRGGPQGINRKVVPIDCSTVLDNLPLEGFDTARLIQQIKGITYGTPAIPLVSDEEEVEDIGGLWREITNSDKVNLTMQRWVTYQHDKGDGFSHPSEETLSFEELVEKPKSLSDLARFAPPWSISFTMEMEIGGFVSISVADDGEEPVSIYVRSRRLVSPSYLIDAVPVNYTWQQYEASIERSGMPDSYREPIRTRHGDILEFPSTPQIISSE